MMDGISDRMFAEYCLTHIKQLGVLQLTFPDMLDLPGCECKKLDVYQDGRGKLIELVKERSSLTMSYCSYTKPTEARDMDRWHLHRLQTDRFFILQGNCVFGLSDGERTVRLVMSYDKPYMLYIQPGIYHCFLAGANGTLLINFPTQMFNPDDELRIPFKNLEAPHPWNILES